MEEKIKEMVEKANKLLRESEVATVVSINEKGYPHSCVLTLPKYTDHFTALYFIVSTGSHVHGIVEQFEKNTKVSVCYYKGKDSVTLNGHVEFVTNKETQELLWDERYRKYFKEGFNDPKFRLLQIHTQEALIFIDEQYAKVCFSSME